MPFVFCILFDAINLLRFACWQMLAAPARFELASNSFVVLLLVCLLAVVDS